MRFSDYAASLALLGGTTVSAFGRHAAHQGLLQIAPSFAKEGINLYPALHPDHNATDLNHLIPEKSKRLHFSQEGHRRFNLITYHIDCGHLHGEHRSFFRASQPRMEGNNSIRVNTQLLEETEAIHGGHLEWGTYQKPGLSKRQPVKGHVRASRPQEVIVDGEGGNATMDITKDADAFHAFFPNVNVDTDIPDRGTEGGGFLNYDGYEDDEIARRGLFSWIINAFKALINLIAEQVQRQIEIIKTIAKVMIAIAATAGADLKDALDLVYSKKGASLYLNCDACGTKGSFTFDGKLAFSIADGLTKAQISLINNEEFVLEAIVGLKLQGRAIEDPEDDDDGKKGTNQKKKGLRSVVKKEIAKVPLGPALYIPKMLTIGPQIAITPAASLYADGAVSIRTGPRFTVSPGNVTLDAKDPSRNVAEGWEPNFEFVFEQDASIVLTADLAVEVALEFALDVLTGTYKTSVGINTAPSVYFTAEYSKNKDSDDTGKLKACDGGLELRVGGKNRVYSSVFGLREIEFKELGTTFADHGLGCVL
ncbi:hypothetical protein ASPWEDRAFT_104897 [Aspergillus wentii DTO 134E9]|uniref:Uncharacterized protein n=1 Tax=Aspergillus wentii DTO 134E9 TaxID=1073089 RepID=A0A1L9RV91_ASPWE|nr:uncharacterized protein ASPWEDRAFT_104897 [Aspergillus wentii DTO 134E9]OJJ38804.1 hypothetical protein ASPWEDRAFT_104897 [Aspergillus wentii DTO 134E9]